MVIIVIVVTIIIVTIINITTIIIIFIIIIILGINICCQSSLLLLFTTRNADFSFLITVTFPFIGFQLIPAGSELMLNMSSVLHDEKVFEEPEKFKPERYLEGDVTLKKQRTIPFGIGELNSHGGCI